MQESVAGSGVERVWRYLSLSRYLWLLQRKILWLSRADLLGDPWEIPLAGEQLRYLESRHPIGVRVGGGETYETFEERTKRVMSIWRQTTYVNCWCISEHESHALWRVYCGDAEGIAIQTTLHGLRLSTSGLPVHPVRYEVPGGIRQTPSLMDLVTVKRPMFAYESEVRIVGTRDDRVLIGLPERSEGFPLPWNPEEHLEAIYVHPEADGAFMEAVASATAHYTPSLADRVVWSKMRDRPPV